MRIAWCDLKWYDNVRHFEAKKSSKQLDFTNLVYDVLFKLCVQSDMSSTEGITIIWFQFRK